jgi:hypothetical protein
MNSRSLLSRLSLCMLAGFLMQSAFVSPASAQLTLYTTKTLDCDTSEACCVEFDFVAPGNPNAVPPQYTKLLGIAIGTVSCWDWTCFMNQFSNSGVTVTRSGGNLSFSFANPLKAGDNFSFVLCYNPGSDSGNCLATNPAYSWVSYDPTNNLNGQGNGNMPGVCASDTNRCGICDHVSIEGKTICIRRSARH